MPFRFQELKIPGVILVESQRFDDDRGFFMETYQQAEFAANGIALPFVQDNYSHSSYGVLRGLHYQIPPQAQGKLVMAIRGEIIDVAVDIRLGSPTYGQWVGQHLSAENARMLYIPPGFAHGFCVLSERADVTYKVTAPYAPACDRGIIWNDADIGIEWPLSEPILSAKDARLPRLKDSDDLFSYALEPDA